MGTRVTEIMKAATGPELADRNRAVRRLENLAEDDPEAIAELLAFGQAGNEGERITALHVLGRAWWSDEARELLIRRSRDDQSATARAAANEALGEHGPEAAGMAEHLLHRALRDEPDDWASADAARALVSVKGSSAIRDLRPALDRGLPELAKTVAHVAARFGSETLDLWLKEESISESAASVLMDAKALRTRRREYPVVEAAMDVGPISGAKKVGPVRQTRPPHR